MDSIGVQNSDLAVLGMTRGGPAQVARRPNCRGQVEPDPTVICEETHRSR